MCGHVENHRCGHVENHRCGHVENHRCAAILFGLHCFSCNVVSFACMNATLADTPGAGHCIIHLVLQWRKLPLCRGILPKITE